MSEEFNEARLKELRKEEIMHWAQEDALNLSEDRINPKVLKVLDKINLDPITKEEMIDTGLILRKITAEDEIRFYSAMFNLALKTNSPLHRKRKLIN
jgi:hypothetical protein